MPGRPIGRTLILSPFFSPNTGGVETHLDDLVAAIAEEGIEAQVLTYRPLTTDTEWLRTERRGTVEIERLRWPAGDWFVRFEGYPLLQFLYLVPRLACATLWWLIRHPRTHVVHAHGLAAAFIARIFLPLFRYRFLFTSHAVYDMYPSPCIRRFAGWILSGASRIFALSEDSRDELVGIGVPESRISIYRHWVDLRRYSPPSAEERTRLRRSWDLPENGIVTLFSGRLIEKKGVRLFIGLADRFPEMHFLIGGDGPLRTVVSQAAEGKSNLHFVGSVSPSSSQDLYRASDLLIVPSQYEEGFGRVLIEGMATGLPIIASNMGAIPAVLEGTPALTVEPEPDAMATALGEMAARADEFAGMGAAMRRVAEQRYGPANADIFLEAYRGTSET